MKIKYVLNPSRRFSEFTQFIKKNFPEFIAEKDPELFLVCGGDGAMLRSIQANKHCCVPFFGRALGTLNFLMNEVEDDLQFLTDLRDGKVKLEVFRFSTIEVKVQTGPEKFSVLGQAVNDVVIGNNLNGYHEFDIDSKDGSFMNFKFAGTGLCFATTLGSTAYNFNNNGMILPLGSGLWSITGVVCNRHLNDILSEQEVTVEFGRSKGKLKVFMDGIEQSTVLESGMKVVIAPAQPVEIAFRPEEEFVAKRNEVAHRYRKQGE